MTTDVERIPPGTLGAVQETMLLSLWARAEESRRPDAILRDPAAIRLVDLLDYPFERFDGAWKTQIGVAVRGRAIDDHVRRFLARHDDAVVVNVGAGLDARFERVDDGRVRWFDVDLPDAAALRRRLLPAPPRCTLLATSALDPAWPEQVRTAAPGPTLVIAEGVLMFLAPDDVRRLLDRLARTFPGGSMLFDCIGGLMVRLPALHDALPRTRARFRWGARGAAGLRRLSPRVSIEGTDRLLAACPARWRWMRPLRHVPVMRRQFLLARLRFEEEIAGNADRNGPVRPISV